MQRHAHERGFSLIELTIGVVIVGITLAVTVPNVQSYRNSQRIASGTDQITSMIRSAQARARSTNSQIIVLYNTGTISIVDDANDNGVADFGENEISHQMPDGVTVASTTFTGNQLLFNARGRAMAAGTLTVGGLHTANREVRVSLGTGQLKVTTETAVAP